LEPDLDTKKIGEHRIRGALRLMSTDPQRKNGIRPAATSVAIAFLTTARDKAKLVDASVGRDRKFPVAIPVTCTLCNPQKKMNENQSLSMRWRQDTMRD
jgi:hypothetical protein